MRKINNMYRSEVKEEDKSAEQEDDEYEFDL